RSEPKNVDHLTHSRRAAGRRLLRSVRRTPWPNPLRSWGSSAPSAPHQASSPTLRPASRLHLRPPPTARMRELRRRRSPERLVSPDDLWSMVRLAALAGRGLPPCHRPIGHVLA